MIFRGKISSAVAEPPTQQADGTLADSGVSSRQDLPAFILVQLPFVDLRPMMPGEMGRLTTPDWTADDPGAGFVRGFGKMATRNSKGFGLLGGAHSRTNNAIPLLGDPLIYCQQDWRGAMPVNLWFRTFVLISGKRAGRPSMVSLILMLSNVSAAIWMTLLMTSVG